MLTHIALIATLAASASNRADNTRTPSILAGAPLGTCLGPDTPDMRGLVAQLQVTLRSDGRGPSAIRGRHFGGRKFGPESIVPVMQEAVCAKAIRLLRAHLSAAEWTADVVAVVRVDGRYVVNFRFRSNGFPRDLRRTFYFDRGFTRVDATTW